MRKTKYSKFLINRVGEISINTQGCIMEIIECFSSIDNTVLFKDDKGTITYNVGYKDFKKGSVKNYNLPSVFNIGYLGYGNYSPINSKKAYRTWNSMLSRCYDLKSQISPKNTSYVNCFVDENGHNFQNFAKWYEENYIEGFQLDKDILVKGNKIYSPETCCFVPKEVNIIFNKLLKNRNCVIGVVRKRERFKSEIRCNNIRKYLGTFDTVEEAFQTYKTEKEQYIKEVADKWKELISDKVYKAIYNYQVEITD